MDSGKELYFEASSGQIVFRHLGRGKANSGRSIQYLSSGEKQIIILLTYIAFVAGQDTVFIVDEPELSLHPKWQFEFLEAFLALCPEKIQILLATHSPDIVGAHKQECIVLGAKAAQ